MRLCIRSFSVLALNLFLFSVVAFAQLGNSGSIEGVVKDPSGGVVPNATVDISYPISGFTRSTSTASDGTFRFTNIPFNPYHLVLTASGFAPYVQDVEIRSGVPTLVQITVRLGTAADSITVQGTTGADLVENDSTFHTDVDKGLFDRVPLESQSSSLSSLVTLTTPGVVADSNGLFHGLGDHADNSFSYDGQPITDQQSKVFSNQIPPESIQSMEVISGTVPAEFGDKTSVIIKVTTRSGLGQKPTGSIKTSYGSFGSATVGFDVGFGSRKWGNFIAASGLNTSRFLDPPEFHAIHDRGNLENVFDRVDYQISDADTVHVNVGYSRSWFQTPDTLDQLNIGLVDPVHGSPLGLTDQRSLIKTYNIAPVWTHLFSTTTLFTFGAFARHDQYNYYPSANAFADGTGLIPGGSSATVNQDRKLTNLGLRSDISYVKGIHNIKAGITFEHTLLTENFNFGITDPAFNSPCLDAFNNPVSNTSFNDPSQCATGGYQPNIAANPNVSTPFLPILGCIDLTRPTPSANNGCANTQSALFPFRAHADIKQVALYIQDTITKGNWSFNLGFREDIYRGIVHDTQPEPRLGVAYDIKKTNTVLRLGYSRIQATPYNENLILSSLGTQIPTVNAVFNGANVQPFAPIRAGFRNQFNAGFEQAFGKFLVVDADYFWKHTRNGYDFSVFGGTPITFPIAWHNSKLDGVSVRASLPDYHGVTAFIVLGHINARYFPPQVGGLGATLTGGEPFRIDHDQKFQQTTHVQYQPKKNWPWISMNWRYDSGLVASNPNLDNFQDTSSFLDADQQSAIGLYCIDSGGVLHSATLTAPLAIGVGTVCGAAPQKTGAKLVNIAGEKFDVDHNPTRVTPRNLFDVAVGDDNVFRSDRYRWSARFTVINVTNKVTLYNFLSTFSGTHFVTPRTYTAEVGFHF